MERQPLSEPDKRETSNYSRITLIGHNNVTYHAKGPFSSSSPNYNGNLLPSSALLSKSYLLPDCRPQCGTASIATTILVHEILPCKRSCYCSTILQQTDIIGAGFSKTIHVKHTVKVEEMYICGLYADKY